MLSLIRLRLGSYALLLLLHQYISYLKLHFFGRFCFFCIVSCPCPPAAPRQCFSLTLCSLGTDWGVSAAQTAAPQLLPVRPPVTTSHGRSPPRTGQVMRPVKSYHYQTRLDICTLITCCWRDFSATRNLGKLKKVQCKLAHRHMGRRSTP